MQCKFCLSDKVGVIECNSGVLEDVPLYECYDCGRAWLDLPSPQQPYSIESKKFCPTCGQKLPEPKVACMVKAKKK